jgi:hypothetical protein
LVRVVPGAHALGYVCFAASRFAIHLEPFS